LTGALLEPTGGTGVQLARLKSNHFSSIGEKKLGSFSAVRSYVLRHGCGPGNGYEIPTPVNVRGSSSALLRSKIKSAKLRWHLLGQVKNRG
jgi:hypothetical protein